MLAGAGTDVQQQIDSAAGRRLTRADPQVLARGVHAVLDAHHQVGQGHRRLQAGALPGGLVGHRDAQRCDLVGCQFLQPDHGLQRRARHRNHARMTHAHGIRRPADARAQGQRYRPLQGFETAGLHHLARTLGHKLGIPYLRSNGGHAPVPGTAVRTGLNTSEKCNGCRAFHKPERRGGAGPAGLCRAARGTHATRAPAGALVSRPGGRPCAAPARGARTGIRLRPARCAACGAAARPRPTAVGRPR